MYVCVRYRYKKVTICNFHGCIMKYILFFNPPVLRNKQTGVGGIFQGSGTDGYSLLVEDVVDYPRMGQVLVGFHHRLD